MPEDFAADEPAELDLPAQALLYANGELGECEASAFEERLEVDQAAREALCQAVEFSLTLTGQEGPDPAYRQRVRQRLRHRRRRGKTSLPASIFPGYAALWAALGALAAILAMILAGHFTGTLHLPDKQPATAPSKQQLEEKILETEKKARALSAQLDQAPELERPKLEAQLLDLARELVELDRQLLERKIEGLDQALSEIKQELARTREDPEKRAQERYQGLLQKE